MKYNLTALRSWLNTTFFAGAIDVSAANIAQMGTNIIDSIDPQNGTLWVDDFDFPNNAYNAYTLHTGNGSVDTTTVASNLVLITGGANNDREGIRSFTKIINRAKLPHIYAKVAIVDGYDKLYYKLGFYKDSDNFLWIDIGELKTAGISLFIKSNGGTTQYKVSGISIARSYVELELWVDADGTPHWAIDGTEKVITGITDKMTSDDYYFETQLVAGESSVKQVNIDIFKLAKIN